MFPFLNKNSKKRGLDDAVAPEKIGVASDKGSDQVDGTDVHTELSFHPSWNVPKENEYVFRFLNNDLEPLRPNQISLAGVEWKETEDGGVDVTAFVRNSLDRSISIAPVELLLMNDKKELAARREFDFSLLGELPARSSRPWVFHFPLDSRQGGVDLPKDGWTLAFNLDSMREHALDLEPSWEEALSEEKKEELKRIVASLPELGDKELNFMGLSANFQKDGQFAVTLLIRNGYDKSLNLEKLPLEVVDAEGVLVAKGGFNLNLDVKARTTKPWTFIFPKEMVVKENPDLSRWKAQVPQ